MRAKGEIRIHRAWLWRQLSEEQQRKELQRYRLKTGLKQPAKIRALKHRASGSSTLSRASLTMANLEQLLEQLSSMPSGDNESDSISIGLINAPGKAALLTTELYEDLLASVNEHVPLNSTKTVS